MAKIAGMPADVLGQRLREARAAARLTQQVAAENLGLSRTTLVGIEKGDRNVSPNELVQLADLYGVSVNLLLNRRAASFDVAPLFRRSRSIRRDEAVAAKTAKVLREAACLYIDLEDRLGKPLQFFYPPEVTILPNLDLSEQAEDLALDLRKRLGLGLGPIADVMGAVEIELGIRLFLLPLPSAVSGAFAYTPAIGACIVINSHHPKERQAWTFAHELAHFLTERSTLDITWFEESGDDTHYLERFADLFAGGLLLPAATIRRRFHEIRELEGRVSARQLVYLARAFKVSIEALTRRLEQLRLVPGGTYDALQRRGLGGVVREVLGEPGPEMEDISRYLSRFALLAIEAHQRELLSESQLGEYLGIGRIEVRKLTDALSEWDELLG